VCPLAIVEELLADLGGMQLDPLGCEVLGDLEECVVELLSQVARVRSDDTSLRVARRMP
jgi:hypothetical protein